MCTYVQNQSIKRYCEVSSMVLYSGKIVRYVVDMLLDDPITNYEEIVLILIEMEYSREIIASIRFW